MTNFRKLLDKGGCEDNHGCHPTTCICALAGDMVDEIETLRALLAFARVELTNVKGSEDTVEKIDAHFA